MLCATISHTAPCVSLTSPQQTEFMHMVPNNGQSKLHLLFTKASKFNLAPKYLNECFTCDLSTFPLPSARQDNIQVMVIVWKLRGNIIRTALCWIVWHNVRSPQHTYVSSSYRSNRLGLSHWDPYTVHRGGCLGLYYCNMVEWFWWDSSLIFDDQLVSFSALTLLVSSLGL